MACTAQVTFDELRSSFLPDAVPYCVLAPQGASGPLPLCIWLHGGGGSHQTLAECAPLFEAWWSDGSLPPVVLATPAAGISYYLEDESTGVRWDAFIAESFVPHLRAACGGLQGSPMMLVNLA